MPVFKTRKLEVSKPIFKTRKLEISKPILKTRKLEVSKHVFLSSGKQEKLMSEFL